MLTLEKINDSRKAYYSLLVLLGGFLVATVSSGFVRYEYFGDFVSYYTILRNFLRTGSIHAGPYYEHLLGVHSYFTLAVFLPILQVFDSPFVFLMGSVVSWFAGAVLFHEITQCLYMKFPIRGGSWLPFGTSLVFLSFPVTCQFTVPYYDSFQPDFFLVPSLLGVTLGILKASRPLFYSSFLFLLFTKEEFIVLAPLFLAWAVGTRWLLFKAFWFRRADYWATLICVVFAAALAGIVLLHFRKANEINFMVHDSLSLEFLTDLVRIKRSAYQVGKYCLGILPLLSFLFWVGDRPVRWYLSLTGLVFLVGRELLSIAIYAEGVGLHLHTRILLAAILPVSALATSFHLVARKPTLLKPMALALMTTVVLNVFMNGNIPTHFAVRIAKVFDRSESTGEFNGEIESIKRTVAQQRRTGAPKTRLLAFPEPIVPRFLELGHFIPSPALFMWRTVHPNTPHSNYFVFDKIESKLDYLVLPVETPFEIQHRLKEQFTPLTKTKHFLLFARRKQTSSAN